MPAGYKFAVRMAQRGSQQGPLSGVFNVLEFVQDPGAIGESSFALTTSPSCPDMTICGVIEFLASFP